MASTSVTALFAGLHIVTLIISAPFHMAIEILAMVPSKRSSKAAPVTLPIKDFIDVPISMGIQVLKRGEHL
jgi:hypothetical protein